jgi:nitroimidazol reductase NimA-like FMN-containing flavoprotein (pyridoxamine 5'-phosphate oxidase superfamily)
VSGITKWRPRLGRRHPTKTPTVEIGAAGDLGRRIATRRKELHLTIEEVADRAGMAPDYLEYVEHAPTVNLSAAGLTRLSLALETPIKELLGDTRDRAPGVGGAAPDPVLTKIDRDQCEALLQSGGVGRVAFRAPEQLVVFPVNFRVLDGDVVFRSGHDGSVGQLSPDEPVSFEVDHIDDAMSEGWSVLATGTVHVVREPDELREVQALNIEPWAGGDRHTYFRLSVTALTGRVINVGR